jgi:hypothetical protein
MGVEGETFYRAIAGDANSQAVDGSAVSADRWKAEQRDWLVAKLRQLRDQWLAESEKTESCFAPDPVVDRAAKSRTGGCARQLDFLLEKLL